LYSRHRQVRLAACFSRWLGEERVDLSDVGSEHVSRYLRTHTRQVKIGRGDAAALRQFLGAYTHRVAIANSRLVALANGHVTFRWRDSAHGNKKRLMTLPVEEFLRRFLLHLLPRGFMRIRNFGFLANRQRANVLPLCFRSLQQSDQPAAGTNSRAALPTHSQWNCPLCGGTMRVVERLSAAQLLLRSPPQPDPCAA
jgi:hypothetical protein